MSGNGRGRGSEMARPVGDTLFPECFLPFGIRGRKRSDRGRSLRVFATIPIRADPSNPWSKVRCFGVRKCERRHAMGGV